jgi:hypothetical protein
MAANSEELPENLALSPLALFPESPGGDGALLTARLQLTDGCLFLVEGDNRWLPAFPYPGTSWEPESLTIDRHGTRFTVGDTASFGGGESSEGWQEREWIKPPPDHCKAPKVWYVYGG